MVALRQANNTQAIRDFFADDPGKRDMDQIRTALDTFRTNEHTLTDNRTEALKQKNTILNLELYGALIVVAIISFSSLLWSCHVPLLKTFVP